MILKSYSTPVIGSLCFPSSDSPNKDLDTTYRLIHGNQSRISHQENLNLTSSSYRSSLVPSSTSDLSGFRRAKSEGSLDDLDYDYCDIDHFFDCRTLKESSYSDHLTMLNSAPSFSIYSEGLEDVQDVLERTVTIGDAIDAVGSADFSFSKKHMDLIQEGEEEEERSSRIHEEEVDHESPSPPMYLAAGVEFGAITDGTDLSSMDPDEAGDLEEFHKRLVDEYPCHPLFLRNYAKFLQSKGDLHGAEDYYCRAALADPEDSEILSYYAKMVWDLQQDKDKALSYFERAIQASPHDSNVLGAYASFLWEIEDDAEEQIEPQEYLREFKNSQKSAGFGVDADDYEGAKSTQDANIEDYYRRMVKENPGNSLVLSNFARFLLKSKGDLEGAEEYYSQAIQVDPGDGETMSLYAKLVWDLHHDHDKASHYFELAVEATPDNSHVLAAYASFLWEAEAEDDGNPTQDQTQVSLQHGAVYSELIGV